MTPLYKHGVYTALQDLGFKNAAVEEQQGTPYPSKSELIPAERLAQQLEQLDEEGSEVYPENNSHSKWNRPVTWSSPIDISGVEAGHSGAVGMMHPSSPRS